MNIVHVVPHIDQEAAGPSYSVPRLCQCLATFGNAVELTCLAARSEITGVTIDLHPQLQVLKNFAISISLVRALSHKAWIVDVVHNHSLWSMVNVASGWVVPGKFSKLVTSPRGTLSEYALGRSRWIKRLLWPLQRRVLARADMLHATSEIEFKEIRLQGFKAPVVVLPNGIDLPILPISRDLKTTEYKTLLYLGRIHPIKGLDRLMHTWAKLESRHPNWRLIIAGRGEETYVQEIKTMVKKLALQNVSFLGPLYGRAKTQAYINADLFVLPTHSENFGMVVAEALAHGCPVVVSRGAPWEKLELEGCGWWVDNEVSTLAMALNSAMILPSDQLVTMGLRGRSWMERDFDWSVIGFKMDIAYRWLIEGGDCPEWVRI